MFFMCTFFFVEYLYICWVLASPISQKIVYTLFMYSSSVIANNQTEQNACLPAFFQENLGKPAPKR